jgi:lipoate-protein ligase A
MTTWQLLIEPQPLPGSRNMAVDEFLFRSLAAEPKTFLRFYQWARPTASLGAGQDASRAVDIEFCRQNGIDVVRRATGGKLVLHHNEVTYSLVSSDAATFTATLGGSYKLISRALLRGFELMGLAPAAAEKAPPFYAKGNLPCFSHPAKDEIEIGGRKIAGSAQKRTAAGFLQHGSIPLAHDERLLKAVALLGGDPAEIRMTSLSEALGRPVEFAWAVERLTAGFREFFGVGLESLVLAPGDDAAIAEIERTKYADPSWTLGGLSR